MSETLIVQLRPDPNRYEIVTNLDLSVESRNMISDAIIGGADDLEKIKVLLASSTLAVQCAGLQLLEDLVLWDEAESSTEFIVKNLTNFQSFLATEHDEMKLAVLRLLKLLDTRHLSRTAIPAMVISLMLVPSSRSVDPNVCIEALELCFYLAESGTDDLAESDECLAALTKWIADFDKSRFLDAMLDKLAFFTKAVEAFKRKEVYLQALKAYGSLIRQFLITTSPVLSETIFSDYEQYNEICASLSHVWAACEDKSLDVIQKSIGAEYSQIVGAMLTRKDKDSKVAFDRGQPATTAVPIDTPLPVIKIALVGDESVGKTCLIKAFAERQPPSGDQPKIDPPCIMQITFNNKLYNLALSDTEGIDDISHLNSDIDLMLICFSVASPMSFDNVRLKWLPEVRRLFRDKPFLLVGTQVDIRDDSAIMERMRTSGTTPISKEVAIALGKEIGALEYFECSSHQIPGVKTLFDEAIRACITRTLKKTKSRSIFSELLKWRAPSRKTPLPTTYNAAYANNKSPLANTKGKEKHIVSFTDLPDAPVLLHEPSTCKSSPIRPSQSFRTSINTSPDIYPPRDRGLPSDSIIEDPLLGDIPPTPSLLRINLQSSDEPPARRTSWAVLKAVARLPGFGSRSSRVSSTSRSTYTHSSTNDIEVLDGSADGTVPHIFIEEANGVIRAYQASGGIGVQDAVAVKPEVPKDLPRFDSNWKCKRTCNCPLRKIFDNIGLFGDFRNLNALEAKLKGVFSGDRSDEDSVKFKMQQLRGMDATRFQHLLDKLPEQTTDEVVRRKCQSWSRKLARASQAFPPSLFIDGVLVSTHAVSGGGCSDVYQGLFERKQVAVKATRVFRESTSDDDRLTIYMNHCIEALTWRHAAHSARILPLLGVTYHVGRLCLISPWMQNGNILKYLSIHSGVHPLKLIQQIAEGLQSLHELKLSHRNLKPQNILIDDKGEVLLSDLGLTQETYTTIHATMHLSERGMGIYMAPELYTQDQILSNREDASAIDIFAFAMTVYEIMSGITPFQGVNERILYNVIVVEKRRPPLPISPKYEISSALWELIQTCWGHDTRFRPKIGKIIDKLFQIYS